MSEIVVSVAHEFYDWTQLLTLLHEAFKYQENRIDPPSSLNQYDEESLELKASEENLVIAMIEDQIVGCVFVRVLDDSTYLGKFAVLPDSQRRGIGKQMMKEVEAIALRHGQPLLELNTRIELTENHEIFSRFGFAKVSEHSHDGFSRPTYIKMQKLL